MAQNPNTAQNLIVDAFLLIGEFSPDQIPDGPDIITGLESLNDLLDYFSSRGIYIPFIKKLIFNLKTNQDQYVIDNSGLGVVTHDPIIELDYVNVIRETTSYPVRIIKRADLFYNSRQTNINTRPAYVFLIRSEESSTLQFYPIPDFPYQCVVRGKFMLDHLELHDGLDEVPRYYYRFLRYALARELISKYPSGNWAATAEETYQRMFKDMTSANEINVAINPDGILMGEFRDFDIDTFGIIS